MVEPKLSDRIHEFLENQILSKPEEERTKRDDLLLQTGRAFEDILLRHERAHARDESSEPYEETVTSLLKSYNTINRRYDLENVDIDMAAVIRKARR